MKVSSFFKVSLLCILFVIILANSIYAQRFVSQIDTMILNVLKDKDGPGGVFMVAKNGRIIYEKAFGKANIELNVDLTTESVFQIGSMTKQFTAIAILMLEEQGRLDVRHKVSKYIPDYPSGDSITLHHLLTHTSGIKDFTRMKNLGDISQKEMSPKMMVDFFKNEPIDFKPGEKFDYNNSGYVLLGYIIELVSGETYENFIQKHLFEKIGMNNSRYATDRQIISQRAYGYQKKENVYVNKTIINFSIPFSSGALMSTVSDMLKWQNALKNNLLLKSENAKKAFRKYTLNNEEGFTYGYGWHIKDLKGTPIREHGGSIFGFKSMGVYIPNLDIYVIGLSNCDCNSPTQLVRDIAAVVLQEYKT